MADRFINKAAPISLLGDPVDKLKGLLREGNIDAFPQWS